MKRPALLAALLAAIAYPAAPACAQDEGVPSAERFYSDAVRLMNQLPQPANATYTATIDAQGAKVSTARNTDGTVSVKVSTDGDGAPHAEFRVAYNEHHSHVMLATAKDGEATSTSPVFNALWSGVDSWLRFGPKGHPGEELPSAATTTPDAAPPVIAVVTSLSTGNYRVEDRGTGACPNGRAGHLLHLIARSDAAHHPLTDATVDLQSGAFCMMRFSVPAQASVGTMKAWVEVELGTEGGYSVVEKQHFEATARILGMSIGKITVAVIYTRFEFPTSIPAAFAQTRLH